MGLEYKLGGNEMGIFNRKKVNISKNDGPEDPSRRRLLKKAALGVATISGITTAGNIAASAIPFLEKIGLGANDAQAFIDGTSTNSALKYLRSQKYSNKELEEIKWRVNHLGDKLPPGFAHCRDTILAFVYGEKCCDIRAFDSGYSFSYPINERIVGTRNIRKDEVNTESKYIEPAFYFLLANMGEVVSAGTSFSKNIFEINPALGFFEWGMQCYVSHWGIARIPNNMIRAGREGVEEDLTNALFCAGYETKQIGVAKSKEFRELTSLADKQKELEILMKRFNGMNKDIHSCDPNDGYNRCLVAAWSSFMLTRHFQRKEGNNSTTMLIYNNTEVPITKIIKYPIRGPPHYQV